MSTKIIIAGGGIGVITSTQPAPDWARMYGT